MNGAYPGSTNSAIYTLSLTNCEQLHNSWLITEPSGPRELNLDEMEVLNLFIGDYILLGIVNVPYGVSGDSSGMQYIYKPKLNKYKKYCF